MVIGRDRSDLVSQGPRHPLALTGTGLGVGSAVSGAVMRLPAGRFPDLGRSRRVLEWDGAGRELRAGARGARVIRWAALGEA